MVIFVVVCVNNNISISKFHENSIIVYDIPVSWFFLYTKTVYEPMDLKLIVIRTRMKYNNNILKDWFLRGKKL